MEVKSLLVKFGTDLKAMEAGFKRADTLIQKHSDKIKKVGKAMTVAGAAVVGSIGLMVKSYVSAGDEIHKMALRTSFSTETLSELKYAAEISGATLGDVEKGVKKMSKTIVDASDGMTTYVRAFDRIGLTAEELIELSPEEQFDKISQAIARVESPTIRAAAAQDIFGRAGTKLLPLFAEGEEGLEALRAKAREMGIVFDQEAADKAAALNDAMTTLKGSFQGATMAIAGQLTPVIKSMAEKITKIIVKVKNWMKQHPKLAGLITKVAAGGGLLLAVLGPILVMLPPLAAGFSILLGPVGLVIAAIAGLIAVGILIYKNWEPIKGFFVGLWQTITGAFTTAIEFIKGIVSDSFNAVKDFLISFIEGYVGLYTGFFETITGAASDAWGAIVGFFTTAFEDIVEFVTTFITDFTTGITDFFTDTKEIVDLAWQAIVGFFTTAFEDICGFFTTFVTDVLGFAGGLKTDFEEVIKNMVTEIIKKFTGLFTKVKEIVTKIKDNTIGIFKKLKDKVSGNSIIPDMCDDILARMKGLNTDFTTEVEDLAEKGITAFEALAISAWETMNSIETYIGDMVSATSGEFESFASTLKDAARSVIKSLENQAIGFALKWVMSTIPWPASLVAAAVAIASVKTLFAKIKLGEGGIVMSPTVAEIGERGPEAVIPLNKLGQFGGLQPAPVYVRMNVVNYGDINNVGDLDDISDRLSRRVTRQLERGRG